MRVWRYFYYLFLLTIICFSSIRVGETQQKALTPPVIRAASAILIDETTGAVLFKKDPDRPLPPASTTKIVTGMLLARELAPETSIPVSPLAAATPGHRLGLHARDRLPARDMLYAILLVSANDASAAVAEQMAGTQAHFADRMNEEAKRAGATNTHFVNPHGLPASGHVSTVRDLAALARAALRIPAFAAAVRTRTYRLSAPNDHLPALLVNQDPLLSTLPGAEGVKTGFTEEAGYCYVGAATRNGRRLIVALLHSPDWQGEARQLLEYGFASSPASNAAPSPIKPAASNRAGTADNGASGTPGGAAPDTSFGKNMPESAAHPGGEGQGTETERAPENGTGRLSPAANGTGRPTLPGHGEPGKTESPTPPEATITGARGTWAYPGGAPQLPGTAKTAPPLATRTQELNPKEQSRKPDEKTRKPAPIADLKKGDAAASMASTQGSGMAEKKPMRSFWWLWLLLLMLLLLWFGRRRVAQWGKNAMHSLRTALSGLLQRKPATRPIRQATPAAMARKPEKESYSFAAPCAPRIPANGWLDAVLEEPARLLEPPFRRQAAAILEANPRLCNDTLLGLLSSNTMKVRLAACQILARAVPRRIEETLLGILEEERTPNEARQEAGEILARECSDRYEPTWKQMLLRDDLPAAARAMALQTRLDDATRLALRQALPESAPTKAPEDAARRGAGLRAARIALVLTAHEALPETEAAAYLKAVPPAPREQAVIQTLNGVSSPWAVKQMVQVMLHGHAYPALQALQNISPRLAKAALDELDEPNDPAVHTRARIARWLLLKEGEAKEIKQLAQAGNDLAAGALNLAHLHHWQPAHTSPDAMLAAAQIVSLRLGFSDHAPEQIAQVFRQAAVGESASGQMSETPELLPLAEAYKNPEVYEAVQAAMHTEEGLNSVLAEIARYPEKPQYAKELAFWSDKTTQTTRLQIANALAHVEDTVAAEALMERTVDTSLAVRTSALRGVLDYKAPDSGSVGEASESEEVLLPSDSQPEELDQAA